MLFYDTCGRLNFRESSGVTVRLCLDEAVKLQLGLKEAIERVVKAEAVLKAKGNLSHPIVLGQPRWGMSEPDRRLR